MVMGEAHVPKVMSLNPGTVYWMAIFHIRICCTICYVFGKTKINGNEAGVGPFLFKNYASIDCGCTKT